MGLRIFTFSAGSTANEVFSSGEAYQGDTLSYLRDLAWANRTLARRADRVVELVCGMPCVWKGTEG